MDNRILGLEACLKSIEDVFLSEPVERQAFLSEMSKFFLKQDSSSFEESFFEKSAGLAYDIHEFLRHQKRHSGLPYLVHPAQTAYLLHTMGCVPIVESYGWLHDIKEDGHANLVEENMFIRNTMDELDRDCFGWGGKVIEHYVDMHTVDYDNLSCNQPRNKSDSAFVRAAKGYVQPKDRVLVMVRASDKTTNLRHLQYLSGNGLQQMKIDEAKDLVLPAVKALGLHFDNSLPFCDYLEHVIRSNEKRLIYIAKPVV